MKDAYKGPSKKLFILCKIFDIHVYAKFDP